MNVSCYFDNLPLSTGHGCHKDFFPSGGQPENLLTNLCLSLKLLNTFVFRTEEYVFLIFFQFRFFHKNPGEGQKPAMPPPPASTHGIRAS
jgi:hypothetical protein